MLPAITLCAIALAVAGITRDHQQAAPVTEANILAAVQQMGLSLELSEDGTES